MTTLTIEIPERVGKTLADLVEQLGGKVISVTEDVKQSRASKKKQILDDVEESMKFVKLHEEGKAEAKTLEQLLNEL